MLKKNFALFITVEKREESKLLPNNDNTTGKFIIIYNIYLYHVVLNILFFQDNRLEF